MKIKHYISVKESIVLLLILFLFSCSSDDEGVLSSTNFSIIGKWFEIGTCQEQNTIEFSNNGNYIWTYSGNADCNGGAPTLKELGTYSLQEDNLNLSRNSVETIIEGDGTTDVSNRVFVSSQIIEISEIIFTLRVEFLGAQPISPNITITYFFEK